MKKTLIWLAVVAGLIVILFLALYFGVDAIAENCIEYASSYALGVDTSLESADIGIFGGSATLDDLVVENPPGFDAQRFLVMGSGAADLDVASLLDDPVYISSIRLADVEVNLVQRLSGSNYGTILDNVRRFETEEVSEKQGATEPEDRPPDVVADEREAEPEEGKRFKIGELKLDNIKVTATLDSGISEPVTQQVVIKSIRLRDIGTGSEDGVMLSQLTAIAVKAILDAAAAEGVGLPSDIASNLREQLAGLDSIEEFAPVVLGEVTALAGDAAERAAEDVGEEIDRRLEKTTDEVFGRISDILDEEEEKEKSDKPRPKKR